MADRPRPRIVILAALIALALLTALAAAPGAGAANKPCYKQVVDDWYGDQKVDRLFPLRCYREAIRSLPVDVVDYGNAQEDIERALTYARKGKADPGPLGGPTTSSNHDPPTTTPTTTTDPDDGPDDQTTASDGLDTSGPSSLPIPLLVLGGLALLLLAAGGAGYLSRRAQARRSGGPPNPT